MRDKCTRSLGLAMNFPVNPFVSSMQTAWPSSTRSSQRAAPHVRSAAARDAGWRVRDEVVMGTTIHAELWSDYGADGTAALDAVMAEMHRIDRLMSPHKATSELSRINREAQAGPVVISDEMFTLLQKAVAFSHVSNGAFDITYASAGHLYDYRAGVQPSQDALRAACAAIGWRNLILDGRECSVQFARPGMRIDLGGFAKGHAVDNAARILNQLGITNAVISAGGDSRAIGDRRGRPWTIAVRDPRREGEVVAVLPLEDVSISTSGDYERFFERHGERCHHILDPRTGRSPSSVRSVTILANDGLTSEALSKSVFVMGIERGMQLVASQPGADAIVVDAQGALHYSSGLTDGHAANNTTRSDQTPATKSSGKQSSP